MTTLADDVRARLTTDPILASKVREAQKFVIDTSLLDAITGRTPGEIDETAHFARLPFPGTWFEYSFWENGVRRRVGALCGQVPGSAGSAFLLTAITWESDSPRLKIIGRRIWVDVVDPGVIHFRAENTYEALTGEMGDLGVSQETDLLLMQIARIMIGAMIFLAAKHGARSESYRPDDKLQRVREKDGKPPLYSYARLKIDLGPARETVPRNGLGGLRGPMRGHTVRGHMMHTRAGGLVWRRPHIRGDLARGFVVKRYELYGGPPA